LNIPCPFASKSRKRSIRVRQSDLGHASGAALYSVSFVDPAAWASAIVVLFVVTAMANLVPARRAAIVDPSTALRAE
jgi:ABC-type antimicrobial peptide transport system permease subunit